MGKKLFGNTGSGRYSGKKRTSTPVRERRSEPEAKPQSHTKPKKSKLKIVAILLALILFIECAYCIAIFTNIQPFVFLREMYISTAMSTMTHHWLAKAFIPGDIVQGVINDMEQGRNSQVNVNSSWGDVETTTESTEATEPVETRSASVGFSVNQAAAILSDIAKSSGLTSEMGYFFQLFHELDEDSVLGYVEEHPEAIALGWDSFYVNEAGLDDHGTEMYTKQGDQVLAINAKHGMLVIRVKDTGYRGVLFIGKDPSRLKLAPSAELGYAGQHAGTIAENNGGLVAMTGSGFGANESGRTEGGRLAGGAMHSGETAGVHLPWGYKRIELHTDNRLYVTDSQSAYSEDCTDASEFAPALIVDGEIMATSGALFTSLNPRACLGQTKDESIMFLVIEGRLVDSLGTDAEECSEILARYDCYQAMNVDGGSSAILYYEGEYITRCSNTNAPSGRRLPDAWVYCSETVPDPICE